MSFITPVVPLSDIRTAGPLVLTGSSGNIPVAEYIDCVRKVEAAFPNATMPQVLGSLRRLYYGGILFDFLLPDSTFITEPDPRAMRVPGGRLPDALPYLNDKKTLERLKSRADENGSGDNPSPYLVHKGSKGEELIDVGHLLLTFDALLNPATSDPFTTFGTPNKDIASWVADLAIAAYWSDYLETEGKVQFITSADFVTIEGRDANALRNKMLATAGGLSDDSFMSYSVPDSDLLGDVDGFTMKQLSMAFPNLPLSSLLYRYYLNPSGKFVDKRYWFFCQMNQLNYNYGRRDWTYVDDIHKTYVERIDRCVQLFYAGLFGSAGRTAGQLFSCNEPVAWKGHRASKVMLQKFLGWLKPRLEEELRSTVGKDLPKSGNMYPVFACSE